MQKVYTSFLVSSNSLLSNGADLSKAESCVLKQRLHFRGEILDRKIDVNKDYLKKFSQLQMEVNVKKKLLVLTCPDDKKISYLWTARISSGETH